ncbi:MAG: glycosyltransferase family 39 protein [Chloroflexota bacterium]|nr:glycosyltransferase family 39 protein [Chloroflexota bacterium]
MHARTLRTSILPSLLTGAQANRAALAALAVAGGLSRVWFVRPTPVNWDAVQFALALDRFDLHLHQPHPPGYLLYVLAGRAINLLVGEPSLSLSLLSVLFSAVALPLFYDLCKQIFEEVPVTVCAALLMLGSPLALYYGATGLTYVPEMALGLGVAWAAWKLRSAGGDGAAQYAALLGLLLGIAGGVRQTSLLLLLPLCGWALRRRVRRVWAAFVLVLIGICALWLVPLLALSGGLAAYLRENALLGQTVSDLTSIVGAGPEGVAYNLSIEAWALLMGLGLALVPLGVWALRAVRFSLSSKLKWFFIWWVAPPLGFFALTHIGQFGYVLLVLPPMLALSAVCVRSAWERLLGDTRAAAWRSVLSCACLGAASACVFLLAPGPTTAPQIASVDRRWHDTREALARMDPASTALVTGSNWHSAFRHAGYLLPQYHTYALDQKHNRLNGWNYSAYAGKSSYALPRPVPQAYLQLPPGTRTIVALDEDVGRSMPAREGLQRVLLDGGATLYVLRSPREIAGLRVENGTITAVYR